MPSKVCYISFREEKVMCKKEVLTQIWDKCQNLKVNLSFLHALYAKWTDFFKITVSFINLFTRSSAVDVILSSLSPCAVVTPAGVSRWQSWQGRCLPDRPPVVPPTSRTESQSWWWRWCGHQGRCSDRQAVGLRTGALLWRQAAPWLRPWTLRPRMLRHLGEE